MFTPLIEQLQPNDRNGETAVAELIHAEWGVPAGAELREAQQWCVDRRRADGETIFVARSGEQVLGCVGVRMFDPDGYEHLGPWVSCLVVAPSARGRGLATRLVLASSRWIAAQGQSAIYTYTQIPEFYRKLCWLDFGSILVADRAYDLMFCNVSSIVDGINRQ